MRIDNKPIYDPINDDAIFSCDKILKHMRIAILLSCVTLIPCIGYAAYIKDHPVDYLTMQSTVKFEIDGQVVDAHMSEIIDYYIEKHWHDIMIEEENRIRD